MANQHRTSVYSTTSLPLVPRSSAQQSSLVSTTALLNSLHTAYSAAHPFPLDAGSSLVLNTWLTGSDAGNGLPTIDPDLARRAWEHARRRAEDGCVVLASLHRSSPSVISPFIAALPMAIPQSVFTALSVLRPFTCTVTPYNHSLPRYSALAATFTLTLDGALTAASLSLASSGLDTRNSLLNIPAGPGYRAFDVFYYLLTSASTPAEREFLGLKDASTYALLNRSATFEPPSYLPLADDAACAEDFKTSLKSIGIKGSAHRNLLSVLAALLKLGDTVGFLLDAEDLDELCEDAGALLGLEPDVLAQKCSGQEREALISGIYECLVDWVLLKANEAIRSELLRIRGGSPAEESSDDAGMRTPQSGEDADDSVTLVVLEIPAQDLGKAVCLRAVFDDSQGINAEMKDDGVQILPVGSAVAKDMQRALSTLEPDLVDVQNGDQEREQLRNQEVLQRVAAEAEEGTFLRAILCPAEGQRQISPSNRSDRLSLQNTLGSSRVWFHLSLYPTDDPPAKLASLPTVTSSWSATAVSRQLRDWRLPEWSSRRTRALDYTADFDIDEFATRYAPLGCQEGRDGVESWILERGWSNGEAVVGHERVWIHEGAWWEAESMLDLKAEPTFGHEAHHGHMSAFMAPSVMDAPYRPEMPALGGSGLFPPLLLDNAANPFASNEHLATNQPSYADLHKSMMGGARSIAPTLAQSMQATPGDYGLGRKGDSKRYYNGEYDTHLDPELGEPKHIITQPVSMSRRVWVAFVWLLTFWIPSFVLRYVGRMKRPDVRMAWREKLVLVLLIFLLNATVVFYIVAFGMLLCPNFDKAWNTAQVSQHTGNNDFYVSIHGGVYDISNFWRQQHSDTDIKTTPANMEQFAGQSLDEYFPPPLTTACRFLVSDTYVQLTPSVNNTPTYGPGIHTSGPRWQTDTQTALYQIDWYTSTFLPKIQPFYKGDLVWESGTVYSQGQGADQRQWVILNDKVYDLTDYFYTQNLYSSSAIYNWMPPDVTAVILGSLGEDISKQWQNTANFSKALNCMDNVFYKGKVDFRTSPRCQVNNYILLAFTIVLCTVILTKFVSSLQFGSKRRPAPQDKFVICQVPAYTEGEDQLRKGLDSLTALQYDNKRKLIVVICDGMIVGGGNDRPTPKIVLDILGVDPKIDPPVLPFKSVGQGSEQLNYGKVYSGLYEFEGNVVPYVVVVKVGKESEQVKAKPGNRGKRDSQILLLSFLNRVHHRSPMSPLELEMFHQINNIIGVDPELYEYLFMVDADTQVREDSLNRLVASCANDAKIAGICGETSLENEERSWWTMIQVYEYFISHHLAKAFESLFGSVTCLPGCFCMYRLRTADKGRPLIISDRVIREYSDCDVDTLHKKNLLALGEDRYLTTLMTKHFPTMSYKFIPDAYAATAAPETWSVLLSQRRRWINSTVHNLAELVWLNDLCGFCCFSMRFVVFIDLFGTVILPATCAYLGYLIYRVATHSGPFPLISIIMIAAVYGLQALVFILKRQWQHVGWMIIYILAFPIYSFVLPIYSFWKQDDFSWGNTRIVLGEKGNKQIIAMEDEGYDPRSVPLQTWDEYALTNSLPGRRNASTGMEKGGGGGGGGAAYVEAYGDTGFEMDDMQSTYSSVKPASTLLTGFGHRPATHMVPHSPLAQTHRQSSQSVFSPYTDAPVYAAVRTQSMGGVSVTEPYRDTESPKPDNRMSLASQPALAKRMSRSPLSMSRPLSAVNDDDAAMIEAVRSCLADADLDTVTKKQIRALVEQRLYTRLTDQQRVFVDRQIDAELASM